MFDTPNWIGSFITSRTNKDINDLNRKHEVMMEDIKHKHEYLIQQSRNLVTENVARENRESTENVARMNRESAEEIARLSRIHEAEMNEARNKNAISVALIQAASRATDTALPYVFPAILASRLGNTKGKGDGNSNGNSRPSSPAVTIAKTESPKSDSRKKADDLFPELEPTFGVSLNSDVKMPRINVTQLVPAIGAVLSVAAPILAIL